ncbi:MAG: chemotaxis protein CheW [Nitrospirae bacterium]|nr:chemotaxis protein CheW [Nitrospirota bacterium]MBI3594034.1 chemotaxis protein CheW [Nitrospirota bacterium]
MPDHPKRGVGLEKQRTGERRGQAASRSTYTGEQQRNSISDRRHKNNQQYTTFYIDNHYFGIEVLKVQEVLNMQEMTPVPLAAPGIAGLINLRGHIVMALDLRSILGFSSRSGAGGGMNVVVQSGEGPLSFLVDRIGDVIEVLPDLFEPSPGSLDDTLSSVVDGVYKLKDQLLLVLNCEKIFQHED